MFIVMYDIADDKLRTHFSKFLTQYGRRLQFSVFEIANSPRLLENVRVEIKTKFVRKFGQADSVLIMHVPDHAIIDRFGYSANEDNGDLLFFS